MSHSAEFGARVGAMEMTENIVALTNVHAFPDVTAPRMRLTARDRGQLAHARDILASEFQTPPGLSLLARRIGMNASKLCFGFRHQFGETIAEFSRRQRLEMAQRLLQTSELQVRQVARRAGYSHHSTFTAAFSRHFGVSPKAVRRFAASGKV